MGKRLEVCWPYKGMDGKTLKIWASGVVKRVADGLTVKAPRGKKILPAGALLWAWDADAEYDEAAGEKWLILLPQKRNRHVHLCSTPGASIHASWDRRAHRSRRRALLWSMNARQM